MVWYGERIFFFLTYVGAMPGLAAAVECCCRVNGGRRVGGRDRVQGRKDYTLIRQSGTIQYGTWRLFPVKGAVVISRVTLILQVELGGWMDGWLVGWSVDRSVGRSCLVGEGDGGGGGVGRRQMTWKCNLFSCTVRNVVP